MFIPQYTPRRTYSSERSCSHCGATVKPIEDKERGEILCGNCGTVIERIVDRGPERRAFDSEERRRRTRGGTPRTERFHDYGLSTDIDTSGYDGSGKPLSPAQRANVSKMKMWQGRVRISGSGERSLANVLGKINKDSDKLNLPNHVAETAGHTYRLAAKMKVTRSKPIKGITAGSIYLACRKCGVQRSLKQVGRCVGVDKKAVAKYYRLLLKEVETEYIPPPPVDKSISKLINLAKLDSKIERLALEIYSKTRSISGRKISDGKDPFGLAAAYIYMASVLSGEHLPQKEIAEVAEVTEVTVRNRFKEIEKLYKGSLLKPYLRPRNF